MMDEVIKEKNSAISMFNVQQ